MKPRAASSPEAPNDLVHALVTAVGDGGVAELDPDVPAAAWSDALLGPALAMLERPGKDLRARFVHAGFALAGGRTGKLPAALPRVLEILHAGSLIVDDVQDGSAERRGGPALHHLVGAPLAINTGSWMYFWALGELSRLGLPGAVERAVLAIGRCHQGQALDLATRITEVDVADVPGLVAATTRLKTSTLVRLAMELGALAADGASRLAAIGALGDAAGRALQMLDDVGCLVAFERRAKAVEDLVAQRPTWVWAWLAETADAVTYRRLATAARGLATGADAEARATVLATELAAHVETRGRAHVRQTLDDALAAAQGAVPAAPLAALAAELRVMESRYG